MDPVDLEDPTVSTSGGAVSRKKYQTFVIFLASFGMLSLGHAAGMPGYALPQLLDPQSNDTLLLTMEQGSMFASFIYLGSPFGALLSGYLNRSLGRRMAMILDNAAMTIANVIIMYSDSFSVLMVGRVMKGLAFGALMVDIPMYACEIAQPNVRPLANAMSMLLNTGGISSCYVVGALLPWRQAVLTFTCVSLMALLAVIFVCPESHVWLVLKNKDDLARSNLTKLRGDADLAVQELEAIKEANTSSNQPEQPTVTQLFRDPSFTKPFFTSLVLRIFGLDWSGFCTLGAYQVLIVMQSQTPVDPYNVSAILGLLRILSAFAAITYISKVNVRTLYFVTSVVAGLGTTLVGLRLMMTKNPFGNGIGEHLYTWMPLIGFSMYYIAIGGGMSQICFVLPSEILPARSRSIGSGLLNFIHAVSMFVSVKVMPLLKDTFGLEYVLLQMGLCAFASTIFAYVCVPETRGKSLTEIENYYRGERKVHNEDH